LCGREVRVYFAFNEANLSGDARDALDQAAQCVKSQAVQRLTIQGHTDDRGTAEYNLALGERRALAVRVYLKDLGVAEARMATVSVGEERPVDPGHDEAAWAKNRRAELLPRQP
jgi:peptidoglycan-associated lipoprotein